MGDLSEGPACYSCGATIWDDCCCPAEDDYPDDDDRDCFHCGGDGWVECHDPIECTSPHNKFGECPCGSCHGSGLAKDMTIW